MRFLEEVDRNVWKLAADSNVYLLNLAEPVVIDTGRRSNSRLLTTFLDKICPLSTVRAVIFTHLHYDHIGNFDLFPNASFYASAAEIASFQKDPEAAVLDAGMVKKFSASLMPAHDFGSIQVISTPGHTAGSICLWYAPRRILFSGDTIFANREIGRTDLPTSVPEQMKGSLVKLLDFNFRLLCPGHDY